MGIRSQPNSYDLGARSPWREQRLLANAIRRDDGPEQAGLRCQVDADHPRPLLVIFQQPGQEVDRASVVVLLVAPVRALSQGPNHGFVIVQQLLVSFRQLAGQSRIRDSFQAGGGILFQLRFRLGGEGSASDFGLGKVNPGRAPTVTILFISVSTAQNNLEADWVEAGGGTVLRQCPVCLRDSIIGHGRRRKQARDEDHDRIQIRRGLCILCGKTFTFLPPFSPPYSHYSLIARSRALRRYFVERCGREAAAPALKDPQSVTDPSTLRRWFRSLDSSRPSVLRCVVMAFPDGSSPGG